ncbi:uncharacterized protein [Battus philenor]|uniref:uncharacterized protein n=1 Tax=Battus philenor TaxID=42288 RepID=UPI0035CFFAE8
MTEAAEGGAALAWRLLATLEGGSLLLATSVLLAYTARSKVSEKRRTVKNVLVTNTRNDLGRELTRRLIASGCNVSTVTSGAISETESDKIDALVVVGADIKQNGLDALSQIVTEDIYNNIKLLESLSPLVSIGGYVAWTCSGAIKGSFNGAANAYDAVISASLHHIARSRRCQPIWIDRSEDYESVAEKLLAELLPSEHRVTAFSLRYAAQKMSETLGRWLKIVT